MDDYIRDLTDEQLKQYWANAHKTYGRSYGRNKRERNGSLIKTYEEEFKRRNISILDVYKTKGYMNGPGPA